MSPPSESRKTNPVKPNLKTAKFAIIMMLPLAMCSALSAEPMVRVQYNHPGLVVDLGVGLWAWPMPMDWDEDGDPDLVVSCPDVPFNGTYLFENPGGGDKMPVFRPPARLGSGQTNIRVSYVAGQPHVLTPGREWTDFLGTGFSLSRKIDVQKINPGQGRVRANQWHYVDYDGDRVLDIYIGIGYWGDYGWDNAYDAKGRWTRGPLHGYVYLVHNKGTTENPDYEAPVKIQAGGKPVDVYGMPSPSFADFDSDGDLDLMCGEFLDGFTYFENVGTRNGPRYASGRRLTHDGRGLTMDLQMITPTAIDWDKDGDFDLICGDEDGRVALIENTSRVVDRMPQFLPPKYFQQEAHYLKFGALVTPVSVDWDGDGDEDLICGNTAGYVGLIENLDGGNPPRWAAPVRLKAGGKTIRIQAGPNGSIQGPCEAKWGYTTLSVADWDHDGLPDLLVNSIWGKVLWYHNVGTRRAPELAVAQPIEVQWQGKPPKPSWNWWNPNPKELATQWRTTPVVVDWNRDGLNDLVMLDHEGYLAFFRRQRHGNQLVLLPGERIFSDGKGDLRLSSRSAGGSGRRKLCIVDWDRDGLRDFVVNSTNVDLLRNVGVRDGKVTVEHKARLGNRKLAGHTTSPTTVDWDNDGTRDLLIGAEDGHFYYLERTQASKANPDAEKLIPNSSRGHADANAQIVVKLAPLVEAPSDPALWSAWREELARKRRQVQESLEYDGRLYSRSDFAWVSSCYSCCFAMMFDESFYDPMKGQYTIDSFLDRGIREFGGYDAVVLWHAYPRIGFDDRNQFDFYRDMPGGLDGLRELSRAIHKRGAKVFIDYNPWDTGTRREGRPDIDVLVEFVKAIEADGIFLDTLHEGTKQFRAMLDAAQPGVVLESELTLPVERIRDHHMSWAQWFKDSHVPGVLWNKWFERRHMMHQIKRWNLDHTGELHTAWMNGSGILVWENVFGSWVGWNARDRYILRAALPIQRRYVRLFSGERWTPLVKTEKANVYASLWEGDGIHLWTLINRSDESVEGVLLKVPHVDGVRYFDLVAGHEVASVIGGAASITGEIGPRGIGAIVSGHKEDLSVDFEQFLAGQAALHKRANYDVAFAARQETVKPVLSTRKYARDVIPEGMVVIPGVRFNMEVNFRSRECGFYQVGEFGKSALAPRSLHQTMGFERDVQLRPYAIDATLVTNAQYAGFLKATGYKPRHVENFLKHFKNGAPPRGLEGHPVVYVDIDDARAYAKWAGKRLPTEQEWQYAAQGPDKRTYPWGDKYEEGLCNDGKSGGTTGVTAFADGRSSFGCYDMCGNAWEWTESERSDGRTRFCIIRGGSFYKARGSAWYADGGPQPCDFAAKFILMWPGLDRCATIGFRCVVDIADNEKKGNIGRTIGIQRPPIPNVRPVVHGH